MLRLHCGVAPHSSNVQTDDIYRCLKKLFQFVSLLASTWRGRHLTAAKMTSVESSDGFLFSSSAAEDLNNSYRDNLEHLVKMWKQMGLCHQDISARINTMKKKFQDITSIMVEEDQKRMIKFKDLVEIKKAEALDLW